jgi:hypothetical protein
VIWFAHVAACYVLVGFGFQLAAWLQCAEISADKGEPLPSFFCHTTLGFIAAWPIIAVYCYRAEVKKTISKIDFTNLGGK